MDNKMIERCKAELERCFAPAINFKAPYAKVMSDMAINSIIKAMREPTENLMLNIKTKSIDYTNEEIWKMFIDAIISDQTYGSASNPIIENDL